MLDGGKYFADDDEEAAPMLTAAPVATAVAVPATDTGGDARYRGGGAYGEGAYAPPAPQPDVDPVDLATKQLRRGFVRKVFGILAAQLALTFGIICIFVFAPGVDAYVQSPRGAWLYWTAIVVAVVAILALACGGNLARRAPHNYVALLVLTVAMSAMLGVISSYYTTTAVLIAFGEMVAMVAGLSLFACQTRFDITGMGFFLFAALLALVFFGVFAGIFYTQVATIVWCSLAVALFSVFVV